MPFGLAWAQPTPGGSTALCLWKPRQVRSSWWCGLVLMRLSLHSHTKAQLRQIEKMTFRTFAYIRLYLHLDFTVFHGEKTALTAPYSLSML